jgi:hypothetical protein
LSPGFVKSKENDCEKSAAKRTSTTTANEFIFEKFVRERSEFCSGTLLSEFEIQVQPNPQLELVFEEATRFLLEEVGADAGLSFADLSL